MKKLGKNRSNSKPILLEVKNQPGLFSYAELKVDVVRADRARQLAEENSKRAYRILEARKRAAIIASS